MEWEMIKAMLGFSLKYFGSMFLLGAGIFVFDLVSQLFSGQEVEK